MVRWHEADMSRQRRASAVDGSQGNGWGGGGKKKGEITRPRECGEGVEQEE